MTGYENLWQKLIKPLGLSFPASARMNIDSTVSALEMAVARLGPAIIQHRLAEPYLHDGRLVRPVDMAMILFRDWLFKETALRPMAAKLNADRLDAVYKHLIMPLPMEWRFR